LYNLAKATRSAQVQAKRSITNPLIFMTTEKKKAGRKPKWKAGETDLVRLPKVFMEQILAYAHQLDNGYLPEEAAEVGVAAIEVKPQAPVIDEIGYYRLLLEVRNNMDSITPTESAIERLEKVKAELEEQIGEVRQFRQQNREAQRQIREKDDEIGTLQQKNQNLDEKLVGLSQDLERVNELVSGLRAENEKLRLFRSESGESEQLVTEILGIIHISSSRAVKIYVNSIYALSEGKPIDQVRLCLAVMANLREKNKRYNNCCCDAAELILAGATETLQEIMEAVEVDYNDRLERAQQF
jgi:flagellar motility protein MotE (MotC chaperone)